MITALLFALCGAGLAVGLICGVLAVWRPRPTLAVRLARLNAQPAAGRHAPLDRERTSGPLALLGAGAVPVLQQFGLPRPVLRRDLAILDRAPATHLAEQAGTAAVAALAAAVLALLAAGASWVLPAAAAGSGLGFVLPTLAVRSEATKARRDFKHALGAFLDLTVITLAGGAGVETALHEAAQAGDGRAFTQIRGALRAAQVTGTPPWRHLDRLGDELGISALGELAASMRLAGGQGAHVRDSLAAKAASLRTHLLADAETRAAQATERMSLPVVLMAMGFLIFVVWPAIYSVMTGL